ncbi:MAG: hypothetical protein ACJ75J_05855 [Cytophagaceae bacterium]
MNILRKIIAAFKPRPKQPQKPAEKISRFEILEFSKDDESYFYSHSDYSFHILCKETGDELWRFSGSTSSDRDSNREDGVRYVEIDETETEALVLYYDGKEEKIELPGQVTISEERKTIILAFRNGKSEIRQRKPLIHFTKSGDMIQYPLINPPQKDAL